MNLIYYYLKKKRNKNCKKLKQIRNIVILETNKKCIKLLIVKVTEKYTKIDLLEMCESKANQHI